MNREHVTLAVVALACFTAVGTSATTLSSSVGTDPDEAVDPNYEVLPVESDDVAEIQDLIDAEPGDGSATAPAGEPGPGAERTRGDPDSEGAVSGTVSADGDDTAQDAGERDAPPTVVDEVNGEQSGTGGTTFTESVRGLLGLLGEVVSSLLSNLLWVALVLALLALAVRYRGVLTGEETAATDGESRSGTRVSVTEPPRDENVVYAAWDALVRDIDLDREASVTSAECARLATERGHDEQAVRDLQTAFDAVRYGDRPVTEDRRRTVREACDSLGVRPGGGLR